MRSSGSKTLPRVELGSSFYDLYSDIDGNPSAAIVLKQNSLATNAATIIEQVKEKLKEIQGGLCSLQGWTIEVSYDVSATSWKLRSRRWSTRCSRPSCLVALVVFLFLGDWRSTLIPTLAVPVSLIGTFFFMLMFGISINLITLFALVLAIGVVVDDAIVVVEAVHAKMAEKHLSPFRATKEVVQRDQRRHHRHHDGDDGRLHPGDVHDRAGRRLLPPVRPHDGHVDRPLRGGGPDAHAGALRDAPQAPHRPRWDSAGRWPYFLHGCSTAAVEKVTGGYAAESCGGSSRAVC